MVSQKCQYGLRALFELAKHYGGSPVSISQIAEVQAIPARFLEVILSQLKQGGFVTSRRGREGGYLLARAPQTVTAGEVIRFIEGPLGPVACLPGGAMTSCPMRQHCVFLPMWQRAHDAVAAVYDNATLQDLIEEEDRANLVHVPMYAI